MTDSSKVALWLAKVMGLREASETGGVIDYVESDCYGIRNWAEFAPHQNDAQFAQVIKWAAMNGCGPTLEDHYCATFDGQVRRHKIAHDNSPQGLTDAALLAIALATGFDTADSAANRGERG